MAILSQEVDGFGRPLRAKSFFTSVMWRQILASAYTEKIQHRQGAGRFPATALEQIP
jgi:hypothetical protein